MAVLPRAVLLLDRADTGQCRLSMALVCSLWHQPCNCNAWTSERRKA